MPRRAPPTSLRLIQGPTPPRNAPKHTLPSMPRPTFHPSPATKQPTVTRSRSATLPSLDIGLGGESEGRLLLTASPAVSTQKIRGPWDHSGCIAVVFDVENMLAPLKPVAVSL